eukprot:5152405-Pyramimonas_sp.AAC.1
MNARTSRWTRKGKRTKGGMRRKMRARRKKTHTRRRMREKTTTLAAVLGSSGCSLGSSWPLGAMLEGVGVFGEFFSGGST